MILTVTAVLKLQRVNVQQLEVIKSTVTIPDGDFALPLAIDYKRQLSPHGSGVMRLHSTPADPEVPSLSPHRFDDGDNHPYNIQRPAQ